MLGAGDDKETGCEVRFAGPNASLKISGVTSLGGVNGTAGFETGGGVALTSGDGVDSTFDFTGVGGVDFVSANVCGAAAFPNPTAEINDTSVASGRAGAGGLQLKISNNKIRCALIVAQSGIIFRVLDRHNPPVDRIMRTFMALRPPC